MAAAIVIAAVGWYDAERRCRQWQRQAERHQRRAEEADAGAISSSVTPTATRRRTVSWRSAMRRCTQRTTLIRERLAANYTVIAANVEGGARTTERGSTAAGAHAPAAANMAVRTATDRLYQPVVRLATG